MALDPAVDAVRRQLMVGLDRRQPDEPGAIDFGMIVDSSVIMIENCVRHLATAGTRPNAADIVRDAASRSASRRCSAS